MLVLCLPEIYLFIRRLDDIIGYRPGVPLIGLSVASEIVIMVIVSYKMQEAEQFLVFNVMSILATIVHNVMEILMDVGYLDIFVRCFTCSRATEEYWKFRFDL